MSKDMEKALLLMHNRLTRMGEAVEAMMLQYPRTLETNEEAIIDSFCNYMHCAVAELEKLVP